MLCSPLNQHLQRQMMNALAASFKYKDEFKDSVIFLSFDFDNVRYILRAKQDALTFSFFCEDFMAIWKYIDGYFQKTYYPEFQFKVPGEENFPISVVISTASLEKINLQGNQLLTEIANRFGTFKRNFFASPIEIIMNAVKSNTQAKNLCYSLRQGEKTWIVHNVKQNSMTVYYGISFTDKSEQQIVRILLTELTEAKKHVNNSPIVEVSESELSPYLIQSFPEEKKNRYEFTNGITSFTFYIGNITSVSKQASMMADFRQYLQYHTHAAKCNLHARVINRIESFYKSLVLSKFEESTIQYTS